ncbi:hypothetical protein PVAND_005146 [Polypedilum vanderplanki]|uniref:long-chain-fatty-acid--CoA ligase n=1 Tax=Polypedilum vanderplanki TaxID=319348 RepID=A0A9J6C165_POLVA|nr:hypothetical protein PVAND_005146 [Polypedilum vanderplanki]
MAGTEDFRIIDPTKRLKLRINPDNKIASIDPISVPQLLSKIAESFPNHPALKQRNAITKDWETVTYSDYKQRVEKMAKVFIKLGLERYGTVAVLAFNSIEWFVSELAAIQAGGIATGIYTTNSVHSTHHVLETSRANIVIVDEAKQMEKIREIKDKLPNLKAIVQTLPPYAQYIKKEDGFWRWNEIEELNTADVDEEYQQRLKSITPDECCCLVYTSGTTGNPKGAMLCHDNFTWITNSVTEYLPNLEMGKEILVSYLPLSHVAAQTLDIYVTLALAATVYFADRDALKGTLLKTLTEARPTVFLGVPRVYEKIQEKMMQAGSQSGALKRTLGSWAKSVTLQYHLDCMAGNYYTGFQYKLATKLLLSKVKHALGFDRIKFMITGAAPMSVETKKYFLSLDMPIIEAYGMSESSGAHSVAKVHDPSFESIGKTLPGIETKIDNPNEEGHGEICKRGRNVFMGYIGELDKTLEALDDDGWLHTGDIGYVDENGYLFITGRIKELVITAGGENIPPVHIENLVKAECSAISNAFLVGDNRKFLTILISLKTEVDKEGAPLDELAPESLKLMKSLNLNYTKLSEVLNAGPDVKVSQAIQDAIVRANKSSISNAQKVQKFAFLPHDFSIPTGELGPTLKIKRSYISEKYKEIINKLYH